VINNPPITRKARGKPVVPVTAQPVVTTPPTTINGAAAVNANMITSKTPSRLAVNAASTALGRALGAAIGLSTQG